MRYRNTQITQLTSATDLSFKQTWHMLFLWIKAAQKIHRNTDLKLHENRNAKYMQSYIWDIHEYTNHSINWPPKQIYLWNKHDTFDLKSHRWDRGIQSPSLMRDTEMYIANASYDSYDMRYRNAKMYQNFSTDLQNKCI